LALSATPSSPTNPRKIALVTGGTRGIGSGISEALANEGYDLLLTYNTNHKEAEDFRNSILERYGGDSGACERVECVGGDISLSETRDKIFDCLDDMLSPSSCLAVMVHNAGQYVGITAENSDGIDGKLIMFGNGSLLNEDSGKPDLGALDYYHRMYGIAFVDLCERSLARMNNEEIGGCLLGISSPGVTSHYYGPDPSYSMPGSGKTLMVSKLVQVLNLTIQIKLITAGHVSHYHHLLCYRSIPCESLPSRRRFATFLATSLSRDLPKRRPGISWHRVAA